MTIKAKTLFDQYENDRNYDRLLISALSCAVDIDQDWSNEKTVCTFSDGSQLIFNNSSVYIGG